MKMAIYIMNGDCELPLQADNYRENNKGYQRISEIVEVDFVKLPNEEVVLKRLKALDVIENSIRAELQVKLNHIEGERQKLRALTHDPMFAEVE